MNKGRFLPVVLATLLVSACSDDHDNPRIQALEAAADARIAYGKAVTPDLKPVSSCAALEEELKAVAAAEIRSWFESRDTASPTSADSAAGANLAEGSGSSPADYTNNQVAGIDEADFVKTDGTMLYVAQANRLSRMKIPAPGELLPAGSIELEGFAAALLQDGERLLVISHEDRDGASIDGSGDQASSLYAWYPLVKLTLLDWPAEDDQPSVLTEHWYDGNYLEGRLADGVARLVLHGQLPNPVIERLWQYPGEHDDPESSALEDLAALSLDELLPRHYLRASNGEREPVPIAEADCAAFDVPSDSNGGGVSSIVSLSLDGNDTVHAQHVVSNWPTVYMSAAHLYLAEGAQDWWWFAWNEDEDEQLNLHAFALDGDSVDYLDSVRTTGAPINPFALDEHEGVLRVATWTGGWRWWWTNETIESQLHTWSLTAEGLTALGLVENIAPGEQLHAARFVGDTAYLVTFEQTDPLFVIDLSDPAAPAIVGELEVPGFSTYLHPLDGNRLLAVGVGGDEQGATWNAVVSLFDVSDAASPSLAAQHDFSYEDGDWNWSEALYEHKAFQYHAERGLLAVPMGASRDNNGVWQWISTLELVAVDGFALTAAGSIDHATYFSSHDADSYWSPDIRRSFFIGDFIYAISAKAISVHPVDNPSVTVADALLD